ncbi:Cytochrome P450 94A2 [Nymphaea thermarum]|nr:Cytochrome P450 94A2 [Nymphaea thermarum]
MADVLELSLPFLLFAAFAIPLLFLRLKPKTTTAAFAAYGPKSYPIIGSALAIAANGDRLPQYVTGLIRRSPTHTITLRRPFGSCLIVTANPANVEHMLKTRFEAYPKGPLMNSAIRDFLGDGIFNADGETWKIQRKLASHEFSTRSLRRFVDVAVLSEVSGRLLPLLASAAKSKTVLDLQDVLQRFAFDNICKIAFGSDPGCLDPDVPASDFAAAFDDAVWLTGQRLTTAVWFVWKLKRALRIGSEKRLFDSVRIINDFAGKLIRERKAKRATAAKSEGENSDLLSRFLETCGADERFVKDIVVSFMLAGRDTTSAALTWFFWLISSHKHAEEEILREISIFGSEVVGFEKVKEMHYLHAAICESMRLYPPVPNDSKGAAEDDVLPDGTIVPKGARVAYHPYAMGRMESLWGKDWEEFRPERWLRKDEAEGKCRFVAEDPYKYPVFQAGPRVCLGKEMAFVQMKSLAAAVLRQFRVVPAMPNFEPDYVANLTSKMKGGFPVRFLSRDT